MRIAFAGLALESVSFLPQILESTDLERIIHRGPALLDAVRGTASPGGGILQVLEVKRADIVPLFYADAFAAGPMSDDAFEALRDELAAGLFANRDTLDGVALYLHGAMTTPTRTNPDLELLAAARAAVGSAVPITVALDLHGNLEPRMAELANGLFGFHHSPHIDMIETGARAASTLVRQLRGEISPVTRMAKVPLVLPSILTATNLSPLYELVAAGFAWERREPRLIDVSLFTGFAYADVPQIGFSVVAVADNDKKLAESVVNDIAGQVRANIPELLTAERIWPLAEGIEHALSRARGGTRPVVVLEHADRLNESTYGLRQLLSHDNIRAVVPYLHDPKAAAAACAAGQGATVTLDVGGWTSNRAGGTVQITGKILFAGPKSYSGTGPMRRGRHIDLGLTAVIDTGSIVLTITSHPEAAIDRDPFDQFGLDPHKFDIVLLRSKTHFRAVWEELAAEIVIVDTPDWGTADLASLPYRRVREGVIPIAAARSGVS